MDAYNITETLVLREHQYIGGVTIHAQVAHIDVHDGGATFYCHKNHPLAVHCASDTEAIIIALEHLDREHTTGVIELSNLKQYHERGTRQLSRDEWKNCSSYTRNVLRRHYRAARQQGLTRSEARVMGGHAIAVAIMSRLDGLEKIT